jgi:flagellar assembly protein FliH
MAEPIKYTFDQAFDGGAKSRYDLELERIQQEGEEAKNVAHTQGLEEGRDQALNDIEAATQETLGQISQAAHALFSQQAQLEASLKQEMVQLAYAISSKLAPALVREHPLAEIEALIEDCMATAQKEPHLVVRVADTVADSVNERLQNLKASTNFPGDIVLIGEQGFGPQDCRVEWPDGGTERRYSDVQHEIENAVQRFVMSDTDTDSSEDIKGDTGGAEAAQDAE